MGSTGSSRRCPASSRRVDGSRCSASRASPKYRTIVGQRVGDKLPVNWVDIDNPDPSSAEDERLACSTRAVPRAAPSSWVARGAPSVAVSCSDRPTAATRGSARSGSTRRRTTSASRTNEGELVLLFESSDKSPRRAGQHDDTRWRDRDRRGRQPHATSCELCSDGSLITFGENLVRSVQRHYASRASSTTRRFPTTALRTGDGTGFSEFAGPSFWPDGEVVVRQHPGSRHHVCDHRGLG